MKEVVVDIVAASSTGAFKAQVEGELAVLISTRSRHTCVA
jgi:hypothetical protein